MIGDLISGFKYWEKSAQVGFLTAIGLMFAAVLAATNAPAELRGLAIGSLMALITTAQIIFMWANRRMVTPYTQAQRAYLKEDFETAITLLEAVRASGKADAPSLTLLGNTYRQLGRLSESKKILYEALNIQPKSHFSLYGFGRTLLSEGDYTAAVHAFNEALLNGGSLVIHFDLGEALYRAGDHQGAVEMLQQADRAVAEPYRLLMAAWLLYLSGAAALPSVDLIRAGLPFWQETAHRFRETPYGVAISADLEAWQALAASTT